MSKLSRSANGSGFVTPLFTVDRCPLERVLPGINRVEKHSGDSVPKAIPELHGMMAHADAQFYATDDEMRKMAS